MHEELEHFGTNLQITTLKKQILPLLADPHIEKEQLEPILLNVHAYTNNVEIEWFLNEIRRQKAQSLPTGYPTVTITNDITTIPFLNTKSKTIRARSQVEVIFSDSVGMLLCLHENDLGWIESKFVIQSGASFEDASTQQFVLEGLIMEDGNGCRIWQAKLLINNEFHIVAAKSYPLDSEVVIEEFNNWRCLDHAHITKLLSVVETNTRPHHAVFFMELGSPIPSTESEVLYIMEHAFRAVDYLHSNNLVHLDIKLENFVSVGGIIKMIDFTGVCHANHAEEVTCHYTMKYLPPECTQTYRPTKSYSVDIWALGIMFWSLLTNCKVEPLKTQSYFVDTIPNYVSALCKDLLLSCLQEDPQHRPTSTQLLTRIGNITARTAFLQPPLGRITSTMQNITLCTVTTTEMFDQVVALIKDSSVAFISICGGNMDHITKGLVPFATEKFVQQYRNAYVNNPLTELHLSIWYRKGTKSISRVPSFRIIFNNAFLPQELSKLYGNKKIVVQGGVDIFARYFTTISNDYQRTDVLSEVRKSFSCVFDVVVFPKMHNLPWIDDNKLKLFAAAAGILVKGELSMIPSVSIGVRYYTYSMLRVETGNGLYRYWIGAPHNVPTTLFNTDQREVKFDRGSIIVFKQRRITETNIREMLQMMGVEFEIFNTTKFGTCVDVKGRSQIQILDLVTQINRHSKIVYLFSELDDVLRVKDVQKKRKRDGQGDSARKRRK